MRNESFSLKFYVYIAPTGNESPKVYCRIRINNQKAEFSTGNTINPKEWDAVRQRSTKDRRLNEELISIQNKINDIKRELHYAQKPITAKIVKDLYTGATVSEVYLVKYIIAFIDKIENMPSEFSKGTVQNYRSTLKHLQSFLQKQQTKDVLIEQLNYKMISDFDYYLLNCINPQTKQKIERNTVNKIHQRLKAILNRAIKEEILTKNPYLNFTFKFNKTQRDFLSENELEKLQNHSLGDNLSLLKVRDIYMFSVYSGLRFGDAINLKIDNISLDKDGSRWIQIIQEKTKEPFRVPMLTPAVILMDKYEAESKITGYILPRISHQKLNAYLKVIAEMVGIPKNLTHHTARHTFATTITLSNEMPIEVVSKMLGHNNFRSVQVYAKITNQHLKGMTDKLDEKLSK